MSTKYTILLCDDDEFIARMYAYRLEIEGFTVVVINSGEKVIPYMKQLNPDLVVLDLMMSVKNGFEVLQEIQEDFLESLKKIPIIAASNLAQQSDIDTVKKLNAVDFVVKSQTTPKELLQVIQKYLPVS